MLVIPNVCRFAVHGLTGTRPWVNVFDASIPEGRPGAEGTIKKIAEGLLDTYYNNLRTLCHTSWIIQSCSWVDLNSANGTTGSINSTPNHTFPAAGTRTGEAVAANTAVMARKTTTRGRGMKNGRTYFSGITEAGTNGNVLATGENTTWNAACDAIRSIIQNAGGTSSAQFVVAGVTKTGATHANPITAYSVDTTLATQRRRLRP